jgi:uncharacterized protein YjbJ (UPF0337 family)
MLNEDVITGKWKEIRGEIKTKWGKLTDDELEQSKGNLTAISGIIQQRYGAKKEEVHDMLENIKKKFAETTEDIKNKLKAD